MKYLSDSGVKEVILLGQNVNSYADFNQTRPLHAKASAHDFQAYAKGFKSIYKPNRDGAATFAELLHRVASVDPEMRIRFTSPHPKDFSDDVLDAIKSHHNICNQLHMPAQSGSTFILEQMRRGYTREAYDDLVDHVRKEIPGVALSTDMIAGFCGETDEDHKMSVDLMKNVRYDLAFLFAYSKREKTHAARHLEDNVPEEIKISRLQELIAAYRNGLAERAEDEVGRRHIVLVEGTSKRSDSQITGRTDSFKRVIFDDIDMPDSYSKHSNEMPSASVGMGKARPGDYVAVQIVPGARGGTLHAIPLEKTTIRDFVSHHGSALPLEKF